MRMEDVTSGGGYTMQDTDVAQNCTPETYVMSPPINLIKKEMRDFIDLPKERHKGYYQPQKRDSIEEGEKPNKEEKLNVCLIL